jgi:hypothetical protein
MNEPSIKMLFPNPRSAYQAFDMLEELGYRPEIAGEGDRPALAIHIEKHDVQSALEISQAYGGEMLEESEHGSAHREAEYGDIDIPAHFVTEDFSESYAGGTADAYLGDEYDAVREGYRESVYE